MKKIFFAILAMCMMVFPMITNAEEYEKVDLKKYNTTNLIETLESEEIKVKLEGYKETDDQVTIYLFRGSGCGYCAAFLNFLNDLDAEYYNKIKVVAFDAWYDEASSILLGNVSTFLGEEAGGVPYIIIGEQVFPGYAEDYNEGIKAAIDAEYTAKERYNVFDEYNKYVDELLKQERQEKVMPVIYNGIITILSAVAVMVFVAYSNNRLLYTLQNGKVENEVKVEKVREEKEVVVEKKHINHTQNKKTTKPNKKKNK